MKPLQDIKINLDLNVQELSSQVKYFKRYDIDWDVYLPTKDRNLQRDFVWSLDQKRELIWSLLLGRHIPHCAMINIINKEDEKKDIYLIIDGKQRLSSIFDFIDNKFSIEIEGDDYLFADLPKDYQNAISHYHFRYYLVNEPWGGRITDAQKIAWFKLINFAGTPQDMEHMEGL